MGPKKHILFFIFSLSRGGAERVTVNLANHWAGEGQRVTIITMKGTAHDAYELDENITRISMGFDEESATVWAAGRNNYRRIQALRRCLRELRPDIAIAMMTTANCLLAMAGRGLGITKIGSEHTYPPRASTSRIWEIARRWTYGNLDCVIALTQESKEWISKNTLANKVVVINNPVLYPMPYNIPIILPSRFLAKDRKVLVSVGRLAPEKAFDRLLRAFADLARQFRLWDLVIVGEGPLRVELENLAEELGIRHRVKFPGHAGNIADWYNRADLYVLTSKFEGFPNVLGEALAHGLPAVSVDCNTGPRDIIRDGVDGLLVLQDNHNALLGGLQRLMNDKETRRIYGERASSIRDRLSIDTIATRWEALF